MPCEEIWRDVFLSQVIDDGLYTVQERAIATSIANDGHTVVSLGRPDQQPATDLKLRMPSDVRQIRAIKVMGVTLTRRYELNGTPHFLPEYYALRIKEISTRGVMSNNQFVDGALCVLNALPHDTSHAFWREYTESTQSVSFKLNFPVHTYDPQGLACVSFTPVNLPSLTVELVDHEGKVAEVSRVHLWLRVLTTQD